jgi:hypothetical protein
MGRNRIAIGGDAVTTVEWRLGFTHETSIANFLEPICSICIGTEHKAFEFNLMRAVTLRCLSSARPGCLTSLRNKLGDRGQAVPM